MSARHITNECLLNIKLALWRLRRLLPSVRHLLLNKWHTQSGQARIRTLIKERADRNLLSERCQLLRRLDRSMQPSFSTFLFSLARWCVRDSLEERGYHHLSVCFAIDRRSESMCRYPALCVFTLHLSQQNFHQQVDLIEITPYSQT